MRTLIGLLLSATLIAPAPAFGSVVVVFGNGVFNTETDAQWSLLSLGSRLGNYLGLPFRDLVEQYDFALAYNQTRCDAPGFESCLNDVLESYSQWKLDLPSDLESISEGSFWRYLTEADGTDTFSQNALSILESALVDLDISPVTSEDLTAHLGFYASRIGEGKVVILVGHSQGNFFGNLAYDIMPNQTKQGFRMVSVATPDGRVLNSDEPRVTLYQDFIWGLLGALGPTISDPSCGLPLTCHQFHRHYLDGNEAGPAILRAVTEARDDLLSTSTQLQNVSGLAYVTRDGMLYGLVPPLFEAKLLLDTGYSDLVGLAFDPESGLLFSVRSSTGQVVSFDLESRAIVVLESVIELGSEEYGNSFVDLAFSPSGELLVLTNAPLSSSRIIAVDLERNHVRVAGSSSAQLSGLGVATGDGLPYASSKFGFGSFYRFDPVSFDGEFVSSGGLSGVGLLSGRLAPRRLYAVKNSNGRAFVGSLDLTVSPQVFSSTVNVGPEGSVVGLATAYFSRVDEAVPLEVGEQALERDTAALWRMNGSSGSTVKSQTVDGLIPRAINSIGQPPAAVGFNGAEDGAYDLTVRGQYLGIPGVPSPRDQDLTWMGWVFLRSAGQFPLVAMITPDASGDPAGLLEIAATGELTVLFDDGPSRVEFASAPPAVPQVGTVPLNQWSHVALTVSSGRYSMFINGREVGSQDIGVNLDIGDPAFKALGGLENPSYPRNHRYLDGQLDEWHLIHGRAWSAQEISDYYNSARP